jgi:hypothetical protein
MTARARICISAAHTRADLDYAVKVCQSMRPHMLLCAGQGAACPALAVLCASSGACTALARQSGVCGQGACSGALQKSACAVLALLDANSGACAILACAVLALGRAKSGALRCWCMCGAAIQYACLGRSSPARAAWQPACKLHARYDTAAYDPSAQRCGQACLSL